MYRFDWKTPAMDGRLGATHTLDQPFVFDTTDRAPVTAHAGAAAVAETISGAWVTFASAGRPSGAGLPAWPPYGPPNYETLVFDEHTRVVVDPSLARLPETLEPEIDWLWAWTASVPSI